MEDRYNGIPPEFQPLVNAAGDLQFLIECVQQHIEKLQKITDIAYRDTWEMTLRVISARTELEIALKTVCTMLNIDEKEKEMNN